MDVDLPQSIDYWFNASNHDCYFLVGPEDGPTEKIGTFRVFLVGQSEPFRAMFESGKILEKGVVRLPDIQVDIFKIFLKCIYGGSDHLIPHLSFEESANLLYITKKYLVNEINSKVATHMVQLLTFDNIFLILNYPVCLQELELKNVIANLIQNNTCKLIEDDKFLELNDSTVLFVIQQDRVNVPEIVIWEAVLKWGKNKAKSDDGNLIRSCIINHLKFIRFCTMKADEFCKQVISTDILFEHEAYEICKSFGTQNITNLEKVCNNREIRFEIGTPDDCERSVVSYNSWDRKVITISFTVLDINKISFTTSKPISMLNYAFTILVKKSKSNNKCNLGIYLICECNDSRWNCELGVKLFLINQCEKRNISGKFRKRFSHSLTDWGFEDFCNWSCVLDPTLGFIKDNNIIVMAQIEMKVYNQNR